MDSSKRKLVCAFFPVVWMGHLGVGLTYGTLGPIQPYLAMQVGVDNRLISWMWSCRAVGVILSCLVTAYFFQLQIFTRQKHLRLWIFALAKFVTVISLLVIPYLSSYSWLLFVVMVLYFAESLFDTGDNAMVIQLLGPRESRPFVQSIHALAAIGFVAIAILAPEFLPTNQESQESICRQLKEGRIESANVSVLPSLQTNETSTPQLMAPFFIIGSWSFIVAVALLGLIAFFGSVISNYKPPEEDGSGEGEAGEVQESHCPEKMSEMEMVEKRRTRNALIGGVVFFIFCGGLDSHFQSQTYTYGLCGPLNLSSSQAASLNISYFSALVIGRLVSIVLTRFFLPGTILMWSLVGCFVSACLQLLAGGYHFYALCAANAAMGFSISFQFGCCLSWLAGTIKHTKSMHTSIMFIAANFGVFTFPTVVTYIVDAFGYFSAFYCTLVITLMQLGGFLIALYSTR